MTAPLNIDLLNRMIAEKYVTVQKHPTADLFIYNYSNKVQYDKYWNEITLQTRGLILDSEFNVIARPFSKFFNYEEHKPDEIPNLPFDVFEKLDGSLGVLYWMNNKPFIATRGSFTSDQAKRANLILYSKYTHLFDKLDRNSTYLFEIIYPENRIVVDYGEIEDIILLTIIDNQTRQERIENIGFPVVKRYDGINDLNYLKSLNEINKEGFVIRFSNNFRIKLKYAEYVRLHRIITGISNVVIWEHMKDGKPLDELIQKVPDEFYDWLTLTKDNLEMNFKIIYDNTQQRFQELYHEDKKTFALAVMSKANNISGILFNMYNNKSVDPIIWKMIRPKFCKAFKNEEI